MLAKALVEAMWTDYDGGMSLSATAKKYGRDRRALAEVFTRRGLKMRPYANRRPPQGLFMKAKPLSLAEIDAAISGLDRIVVPDVLHHEWRSWTMERRIWFINRARATLNLPDDMPPPPFSKNVTPFYYGHPEAMRIAGQLNDGRSSHQAGNKMKVGSRGLIYKDTLYFWTGKDTGYQVGPWKSGVGRPMLHHVIWEEHNGRPVPPANTVIFVDGNKNNFSPRNLTLRSMADCARQNMSRARLKSSRERTAILLKRSIQRHTHDKIESIHLRSRRNSPGSPAR